MSFTSNVNHTCAYCGMVHSTKCPLVKAIEYYPNGTVSRVEFHKPQIPSVLTAAPSRENPGFQIIEVDKGTGLPSNPLAGTR